MFNSGVKSSQQPAISETSFTVVVLGLNRGGTSAIAQVLAELGVPMGRCAPAPTYEDKALAEAFRAKNWRQFAQCMQQYQLEFGRFGWKLPESFTQLSRIEKICPQPRYVVVYRDIFAIANRQEMVGLHDSSSSMLRSLAGYKTIVKFASKTKRPVLHLSYEKLLQHPESAVRALLEFCQLEVTESVIATAIAAVQPSPEGYLRWVGQTTNAKLLSQHGYLGYLDTVTSQRVTGWVVDLTSDENVEVHLYLNGGLYQSAPANRYRADIQRAGHSQHGLTGYHFELAEPLQPNDQVSVRIRRASHAEPLELIGSPLSYVGK